MTPAPTYLRVVLTARCSLACTYCHQEGDPATAQARGLTADHVVSLVDVAVAGGVRKLKFLGGEPLLRADLPEIIGRIRRAHPTLDISLITGGVVPAARLEACFEAGLSRANLSIHGWTLAAFQARARSGPEAHARRARVLSTLLDRGRFLKLNYVWGGPSDDADLGALLADMAGRPVVVGVLDDLGDPSTGPADVIAAVERLRGPAAERWTDADPHSLSTLHLRWADGLEVEVKDQQLGALAPWAACRTCPVRARCTEGIYALRLSHDGQLRPCMDRPDLGVDLGVNFGVDLSSPIARDSAARAWAAALTGWLREVAA